MSTTEIAKSTRVGSIGRDSAGIRMTPEEFDAIEDYDELYRYELVDGVLVVNAIPHEAHASPNELLGALLYIYKTTHPDGTALDDTLQERFIYLPNSRRRADRVVWAGLGRQPKREDVPTIAIEFVSPGKRAWRRDYIDKRDEYLEAGVVEYWVIDRFDRKMTVYRSVEKKPPLVIEIGEKDKYRTDLLPGFELPLAELLAAADKWEN
jgi:Uma2 family endonuclease